METIKYVGTATRRVISPQDWERAGVSNEPGVVWDGANGYTVDASKLSQAARDAIKADPFFIWSKPQEGNEPAEDEEEVVVDLDVAQEVEDIARANSTSADGTGLDEPAEEGGGKASRKKP